MNIDIRDIVTDEILKLQESFANATGFGVVFTDKDGNHIGEGSNFQKICQAINATEEGKASCAMSNHHAIDLAMKTGKPSIYVCHAGMVNIEIPIVIDGEFIGAFTAGQVFSEDMSNFPCEPVPKPIAWHEKNHSATITRRCRPFEASKFRVLPMLSTIWQSTVWESIKASK